MSSDELCASAEPGLVTRDLLLTMSYSRCRRLS
jgi:hypothetical protein